MVQYGHDLFTHKGGEENGGIESERMICATDLKGISCFSNSDSIRQK